MKRICVFCGSSFGAKPAYLEAAQALGKTLVKAEIDLIYGGGNVGLMGAIADTVLAGGGRAIGVIPQALMDKEVGHTGLSELHVVGSMHERKALMAELADAFIALPGGFGTFEEFCEVLTWAQLGFHQKPCGLLNAAGYYDALLALFDQAVTEGFVRAEHRAIVQEANDPKDLIDRLKQYQPLTVAKWIDRESQL